MSKEGQNLIIEIWRINDRALIFKTVYDLEEIDLSNTPLSGLFGIFKRKYMSNLTLNPNQDFGNLKSAIFEKSFKDQNDLQVSIFNEPPLPDISTLMKFQKFYKRRLLRRWFQEEKLKRKVLIWTCIKLVNYSIV